MDSPEKGSSGQNHFSSDSHCPIKKSHFRKTSHSPSGKFPSTPKRYLEKPAHYKQKNIFVVTGSATS